MTFVQAAEGSSIAIVGGGRWARTIAGVLGQLCDNRRTIVLCSPAHPEGWHAWLRQSSRERQRNFSIANTLEQIASDESIRSVFVVRAARDNAATAMKFLSAGKATFVEKPFALTRVDAKHVIAAAMNARCAVGHVLLFSSSVKIFTSEVAKLAGLKRIAIEWYDGDLEFRHGEEKHYDHSINVVQDVFPHLWSLVRLLVPDYELRLNGVQSLHGGRDVQLELSAADIQIVMTMKRNAPARRRALYVTADVDALIDFSNEPGLARIGSRAIDVATGFVSPLAQELSYFLDPSSDPGAGRFAKVENALEVVTLSEEANRIVHAQQGADIELGVRANSSVEQRESALFALREWIASDRCTSEGVAKNFGEDDKKNAQKLLKWLTDTRRESPFNEMHIARWIQDWRLT